MTEQLIENRSIFRTEIRNMIKKVSKMFRQFHPILRRFSLRISGNICRRFYVIFLERPINGVFDEINRIQELLDEWLDVSIMLSSI